SLLLRAVQALGRRPYDIVHAQFGTVGLAVHALRRHGVLEGRLVVHFRGADSSSFVRARGEDVYDDLFAGADHLLTNSDWFHRRLADLGCPPERLGVLRSGIDPAGFPYREPRRIGARDTLRLVTVGRLVEKKGVE